jgi:proteasome accessory factor B
MEKLERLLNLTAALLDTPRPLSAEDLRERIGGYPESKAAFRRSFERDKDDLRAMGVPILVEPVPGTDPPLDGYRIHPGEYAGRDLRLEPDELASLHLASGLVRLEGGIGEGLRKLGSDAAAPEDASTGESPADAMFGHVPFGGSLSVLVSAASERRSVSFRYNGTDRQVEPWRLTFTRGHWYLVGWDRGRDDERVYRVDRIEGDVEPGDASRRPVGSIPDPGALRGWELGDGEPVMAELLVDADQAAWARYAIGSDGDQRPDGSVVFTVPVRNREAFRSLAISLLEHAEVLGPRELREDIVTWLEHLV